MRIALIAVLAAVAAGCGGHDRSVLYAGQQNARTRHLVADEEARRVARRAEAAWERELRRRAREAPAERFENLSQSALRARLRELADRHEFEVVSVRFLRPRQLAPKIAVRTERYADFARAMREIFPRLDPHSGTLDDEGWSYEGFFLEARDERDVPFLLVFNFWRGRHPGGGQWARSEPLYPFAHA